MRIQPIDGVMAWKIVKFTIEEKGFFSSVKGLRYESRVDGNAIYYSGEGRNGGLEEKVEIMDFIKAFNDITHLETINTNTIKDYLPNVIYRKRTPFIGLLYSAGILQ